MSVNIGLLSVTSDHQPKGEVSYTALYQVVSDSRIGPLGAKLALGINAYDYYLTDYEYDTNARCTSIAPSQVGTDGKQYQVTVTYKTVENTADNPLDEPVKYSINFNQFTTIVEKDIHGNAILNACNQPYISPTEKDDSRPVLSIERNEATYNIEESVYYRNTVNLYPIFGVDKGCCMLRNRSAVRNFSNTIGFYWQVSYEFEMNLDSFKKSILNQGLSAYKEFGGKTFLMPIFLKGQQATEPVLLGTDGKVLPKLGTPVFTEYEIYNYADFSVFGF